MPEMKKEKILFLETWKIYKKNFANLTLITLLLCSPIILLYFFAPYSAFDFKISEHLGYFLLTLVVGVLIGSMLSLAITYVVYTGARKKSSFKEVLKYSFSNYWNGLGTNLLSGIMLIGLFILLIVPGLIFALYWAFIFQVIVIKKLSGKNALDYSKSLVKGRWWKTFGYLIYMGFIPAIIMMASSFTLSNFYPTNLGYCIYYLISVIAMLFANVAQTVIFLELDRTKVPVLKKNKK